MNRPLEGKIALVTGASRGIGAAIARRLAADGAELVLHFGTGRAEAERLASSLDDGHKVHLLQADLAAVDGGQQLVERLLALKLPRIDILVNNAGVAVFAGLATTSVEEFEKLVSVNMRSLFFITQGVVPLIPDGGRVINIGTAATRITFPGITAYSASKGFVDTAWWHSLPGLTAHGPPARLSMPAAAPSCKSGQCVSASAHGARPHLHQEYHDCAALPLQWLVPRMRATQLSTSSSFRGIAAVSNWYPCWVISTSSSKRIPNPC
jgi:3-oxoacyl-[acyl-carrier protein] reductase